MSADNPEKDLCLPLAPHGLCFDRLDFVKDDFSVDAFLATHSDGISLETMRDDLGAYLKVLRLAMIELINRDYAKFVNLSATLVGFDKAVDKIQQPLGQLEEEVLNVKQSLEDAMRELSIWRSQESILRQKKLTLKYYRQTLASFKALENILKNLEKNDCTETITQIERATLHYNNIQFTIPKCGSLIKDDQQKRYFEIGQALSEKLDDLLFYYWKSNDDEGLLKTLLALSSLSRVSETESLLRKRVVAPYLHDIIAESNLQCDPKGLEGIYEKILLLLDNELKLLVLITGHSKLSILVNKYNFLINCFWPEVESRIEVHLASIFAPGNPSVFYSRYTESMEFLKKLEKICDDARSIARFRSTAEYKSFQKKWNLPVYYQIRFQEIAGDFESSLALTQSLETRDWRLPESACLWSALHRCWSEGVYVQALAHKLWKLSLQLLARYNTWIRNNCKHKPKPQEPFSIDDKLVKNSIHAYLDLQRLLHNLPNFLKTVKIKIGNRNLQMLDDSLRTSTFSLSETVPKIRKCIANEYYEYFVIQLKQVSEIPRLYRKTNRSVPTKPCGYIEVVSKATKDLKREYKNVVEENFMSELIREIFAQTTESYYTAVEEVLTSVQKTEESLRRLKQIRDGAPQTESSGVSDGDKIRLQLKVDVMAYRSIVAGAKIGTKIDDLEIMVSVATKNIEIKL